MRGPVHDAASPWRPSISAWTHGGRPDDPRGSQTKEPKSVSCPTATMQGVSEAKTRHPSRLSESGRHDPGAKRYDLNPETARRCELTARRDAPATGAGLRSCGAFYANPPRRLTRRGLASARPSTGTAAGRQRRPFGSAAFKSHSVESSMKTLNRGLSSCADGDGPGPVLSALEFVVAASRVFEEAKVRTVVRCDDSFSLLS